jgi:hypothetical protein
MKKKCCDAVPWIMRLVASIILDATLQSQAGPTGICGGNSGSGTGFRLRTSVFPSVPFHRCSTLIHSSIPDAVYSHEMTASSSHELKKAFALLRFNAAYFCSCLPAFRNNLSVPLSWVKVLDCLTHEDGTDTRNVGKQLPAYAA